MAFSHSWPAKYLLPCAFSSTDSSLAPMSEYYQIRCVELRACNCFSKSLCPKINWVKIMTRCWDLENLGRRKFLGRSVLVNPRADFSANKFEQLQRSLCSSSSVTFLNLHQSHTGSDEIEMSAFVPGSQQRYLRACMVCSIVQTHNVCTSSLWFLRSLKPCILICWPFLPIAFPPWRMSELRRVPQPRQLHRSGTRMHIASLWRTSHTCGSVD